MAMAHAWKACRVTCRGFESHHLRQTPRPYSSTDRVPVSGTEDGGSIPPKGTDLTSIPITLYTSSLVFVFSSESEGLLL